jgi:hypothetical protein
VPDAAPCVVQDTAACAASHPAPLPHGRLLGGAVICRDRKSTLFCLTSDMLGISSNSPNAKRPGSAVALLMRSHNARPRADLAKRMYCCILASLSMLPMLRARGRSGGCVCPLLYAVIVQTKTKSTRDTTDLMLPQWYVGVMVLADTAERPSQHFPPSTLGKWAARERHPCGGGTAQMAPATTAGTHLALELMQ